MFEHFVSTLENLYQMTFGMKNTPPLSFNLFNLKTGSGKKKYVNFIVFCINLAKKCDLIFVL